MKVIILSSIYAFICSLGGCSSGPRYWKYEFSGATKNLLGCGVGSNEREFRVSETEIDLVKGNVLFYSNCTTALILKINGGTDPFNKKLKSAEGELEAWLLRVPTPYAIYQRDLKFIDDFIEATSEARRNELHALELIGEIKISGSAERISEIEVDLRTLNPVPPFIEFLERIDKEGCDRPGLDLAMIKGTFVGAWRSRFWLFI